MQLKQLWLFISLFTLALANSYILVFEQGELTPNNYVKLIKDKIVEYGGKIKHEYSTILTGFAFNFPNVEVSTTSLSKLEKLKDSKYPFFIEKDSTVEIQDV